MYILAYSIVLVANYQPRVFPSASLITLHFIPFVAATSEPQTPAQNIDYNFARDELMTNELSNDPIQAAIARLEKQHEEDKQGINYV